MNSKTFTGYYDKNGNKIYEGDLIQWGEVGRFYVFYAPHIESKWIMVYDYKCPTWDRKTADYYLSIFDDDNDKILKLFEKEIA